MLFSFNIFCFNFCNKDNRGDKNAKEDSLKLNPDYIQHFSENEKAWVNADIVVVVKGSSLTL